MNIKGLDKINMPRSGDVMIYKKDTTLKACKNFNAQIQVLDVPGQLKCGYSPVALLDSVPCPGPRWALGNA